MGRAADVPPGYEFAFDVFVDGEFISSFNSPAEREFLPSDLIDLGEISQGEHTFAIEWTNNTGGDGFDTNLDTNAERHQDTSANQFDGNLA